MSSGPATEVWQPSATESTGAVRARQVSGPDVVQEHLRRTEAVDPSTGAVVALADLGTALRSIRGENR